MALYGISNSFVQDGISALHAASEEGHSEVVDILLRSEADLSLVTLVGNLAFFCSSYNIM